MIVRAALALLALRTGTSIAYPSIDSDLAHVHTVTGSGVSVFDASNIMAGLAGFGSAFFGGAPLEPIITGTSSAQPSYFCGNYDGNCSVILLLGLIGRASKVCSNSSSNRISTCVRSFDNISWKCSSSNESRSRSRRCNSRCNRSYDGPIYWHDLGSYRERSRHTLSGTCSRVMI